MNIIKDLLDLAQLDYPVSFSKKRILLNFMTLYFFSIGKKKAVEKNVNVTHDVEIESEIWQCFDTVLSLYIKRLAPEYLMKTYVLQKVATGWHSESYINFLKENFKEEHINQISAETQNTVEKIARAFATEFKDVPYNTVYQWLLTYQFGFTEFIKDQNQLSNMMEDMLIIELGAGTGANVAVHSAMSKKGVYIFDIPPMLEVQKITMDKISRQVDMSKITYFSDPQKLIEETKGKPYIVVSYWAFTEFPVELRKTLEPLLDQAEFCLFASNPLFEGLDNKKYFEDFANERSKKELRIKPIDWNPYKTHMYVFLDSVH